MPGMHFGVKGSLAAALAVCVGMFGSAGAAHSEVVLSYSPWLPPAYVANTVINPWMAKVAEVTEGRVRVEPRAAGVGSPREQPEVVRDGLADVSIVVTSYNPGRYPLMELSELPLLSDNPAVLSPAFWRQFEQHILPHKPFEGAHVLSAWSAAPSHVATGNRIIKKPADLAGLKMYVANAPLSVAMETFGVVPISASVAEIYTMASTGIIDGTVFPREPVVTWNLYSAFKYYTLFPGGVGQPGMALLVNEDKWNSIGEEDRAAIMEISGGALAAALGQAFQDGELRAADRLRQEGVTIEETSPEVLEAFSAAVEKIHQDWIRRAKEAGLANADEVLLNFQSELRN